VILRGHQANPWELAPWQEPALAEQFEVSYLRSRRGWFDTSGLALRGRGALTLRDLLPPGRAGDLAVRVPGDRYLRLAGHLRGADIVHAQELGYWYSQQAALLRERLGFTLLLTVWETLPFLDAYRNVRTRPYRRRVLAQTDLFLAATERARSALLLEGAPPERIRVCPPGVDVERFAGIGISGPDAPTILAPARLVWEKGHHDILRALALMRHEADRLGTAAPRLVIVGRGPEERRLREHASELGIGQQVEFRGFVPYEEMPALYAGATCLVLASLPTPYWEEQFGMVLAEAMACGLPIVASASGAIPEVTAGHAQLYAPGDWVGLAALLAEVVRRDGSERERITRYSTTAAAEGIAAAYGEALARRSSIRRS
jgi:glycosyltransferase involved in cell wall biosynthesis